MLTLDEHNDSGENCMDEIGKEPVGWKDKRVERDLWFEVEHLRKENNCLRQELQTLNKKDGLTSADMRQEARRSSIGQFAFCFPHKQAESLSQASCSNSSNTTSTDSPAQSFSSSGRCSPLENDCDYIRDAHSCVPERFADKLERRTTKVDVSTNVDMEREEKGEMMCMEEVLLVKAGWTSKLEELKQNCWALEMQLVEANSKLKEQERKTFVVQDSLHHVEMEAQDLHRMVERLLRLPMYTELQAVKKTVVEKDAEIETCMAKFSEMQNQLSKVEKDKSELTKKLRQAAKDLRGVCYVQAQLMESPLSPMTHRTASTNNWGQTPRHLFFLSPQSHSEATRRLITDARDMVVLESMEQAGVKESMINDTKDMFVLETMHAQPIESSPAAVHRGIMNDSPAPGWKDGIVRQLHDSEFVGDMYAL